MEMSSACFPPNLPRSTQDERDHPRYPEYRVYLSAMRRQLVHGATFASWLDQTRRDEDGFSTVFEVSAPEAKLKPGWYRTEFGPKHRMIRLDGPFNTQAEAEQS